MQATKLVSCKRPYVVDASLHEMLAAGVLGVTIPAGVTTHILTHLSKKMKIPQAPAAPLRMLKQWAQRFL
jgi:hypothetical protein